jgi:hypothetical protein
MKYVALGAGTLPDVTATPDGAWVYAWQPLNAPYVQLHDGRRLLCGDDQLAFVRLGYAAGGVCVAWRGLASYAYLVRLGVSETARTLGPTGGNCPLAVDNGVVAWQAPTLVTRRATIAELSALPDVDRWTPTGLCTAQPLTYIDDVRTSEPGMYNPVRAGDLVVGECLTSGGVLCRLTDGRELLLWPNQDTVTPRCAATLDGGRFAVCTWGKEGVRVALDVRPEDFAQPGRPVVPPIEPPIDPEEPVVLPPKVEGPNGTDGVAYTKEMKRGKEWTIRAQFTSPVDECRITIDENENLTVTCRNAAGTGATGKRRLVAGRC